MTLCLNRPLFPALPLAAALALSACVGAQGPLAALPGDAAPETVAVAQLADDLGRMPEAAGATRVAHTPGSAPDASLVLPVRLVGRGYGQVSGQPGTTANERRLMAIRAARMEAFRDLTEQVHGVRIDSRSMLRDAVLGDDSIEALVAGEIRGARTVSITPRDGDSFEVVLELSTDTVRYILRAAQRRM